MKTETQMTMDKDRTYYTAGNKIYTSDLVSEDVKDAVDDLLWYDLMLDGNIEDPSVNEWVPNELTKLLNAIRNGEYYEYVPDQMIDDMAREHGEE